MPRHLIFFPIPINLHLIHLNHTRRLPNCIIYPSPPSNQGVAALYS